MPRSIETLGEAILNLSGQIDLPITLETSHYLFIVIFFWSSQVKIFIPIKLVFINDIIILYIIKFIFVYVTEYAKYVPECCLNFVSS